MQQIPLSLPVSPSYRGQDFIKGSANEDALNWLSAWPKWPLPYRVVNIFGPSGCGKTHLSHLFAEISGARHIDELVDLSGLPDNQACHLILDNFDLNSGYQPDALFHLFNHLAAVDGTALLLSHEPVSRMICALDDLRSRLRAVATQQITYPDDVLLARVLEQMFADRQCAVSESVIRYMVTHMERNFTTAYQLVAKLDHQALAQQKPVSLSLVKSVL